MRNTPRATLAAIALLAAPLVACGSTGRPAAITSPKAPRGAGYRLFWVGKSFEGLSLVDVSTRDGATSLIYGRCTPIPTGDGASCTPPLEIQITSVCLRNALLIDIRPRSWFRRRGTIVFEYPDRRLELASGGSQIVVFAHAPRARRAIDALRPVGLRARPGEALPAPRYPRSYLAQLRRVRDSVAATRSIRAARTRLHISKSAVRFELALAGYVSPDEYRSGAAAKRCAHASEQNTYPAPS